MKTPPIMPAKPAKPTSRYLIVVQPEPTGTTTDLQRLKLMLKRLGRTCGLRCVSVTEHSQGTTEDTGTPAEQSATR